MSLYDPMFLSTPLSLVPSPITTVLFQTLSFILNFNDFALEGGQGRRPRTPMPKVITCTGLREVNFHASFRGRAFIAISHSIQASKGRGNWCQSLISPARILIPFSSEDLVSEGKSEKPR